MSNERRMQCLMKRNQKKERQQHLYNISSSLPDISKSARHGYRIVYASKKAFLPKKKTYTDGSKEKERLLWLASLLSRLPFHLEVKCGIDSLSNIVTKYTKLSWTRCGRSGTEVCSQSQIIGGVPFNRQRQRERERERA